jgi:hypothetical protein
MLGSHNVEGATRYRRDCTDFGLRSKLTRMTKVAGAVLCIFRRIA